MNGETRLRAALILGYGNVDRQDDGVAWHVLNRLAKRLGRTFPPSPEDDILTNEDPPDMLFVLQLVPELAETISQYGRVCFVDAHTGHVPEEVQFTPVVSEFQTSPFTHHLTPSSCLSLAETLYGRAPEAVLTSVRGYEFGFTRSLSSRTEILVEWAVERILEWLQQGKG